MNGKTSANILIVDDTPNNLRLLSTILTDCGYEVGKAINGEIALRSANAVPPDLILLDINMPGMNGYEVCEELKIGDRTQNIPVIFISALDDVLDKVKAFNVGGVDYVTKPFQAEEVLARVRTHLDLQTLQNALRREQKKSEDLLLNTLPKSIVEELKEKGKIKPRQYQEAGFLFIDLVRFAKNSGDMTPAAVVDLLNRIFSAFDLLVEKHGVEKIRTIGDSYFVASGLPIERDDFAEILANMALDMRDAIAQFRWPNGKPVDLRIGVNIGGPVVAAVIGTKKFAYDVWGNAVNLASRMESHGKPGQIHVTAAVYKRLKTRYRFEERGEIEIKGKIKMNTYWLVDRE